MVHCPIHTSRYFSPRIEFDVLDQIEARYLVKSLPQDLVSQRSSGRRVGLSRLNPITFLPRSDQPIPAGGWLNHAYVTQGGKNSMDMVILHSFSQAARTVKV